MTLPEQWPKVKAIVGEALDRDPGERAAFLDQVCSQDLHLRAEVESLLAAYSQADGFLTQAWGFALHNHVDALTTIGPYRLERELGTGGMGQVWLAEQTEPVQRWIALKLIRAGLYDSTVVQRFLAERQSLALMNHPAIAKVFDAGTTAAGQPYFAMEYVDGLPITAYCDEKKLGVAERLRLFLQVCEGVQHAHQKAIIHRDLKPSNILVVEVDGKPAPRIIDFGLAKSAAPALADEIIRTQVGAFLGTPGYMSPEQADPHVDDIDTRTDVYSLGVVLYELLTGFLPFDTEKWKKQRIHEVLRELRETDPERPSAKVRRNRDTSAKRAEARGMETGRLVSLLRGDLDWIILKALEKNRDRRYGTAVSVAADVENYLQNRPVEARPASAAYRVRKYLRRHPVGVSVPSAAAALLIAFALTQSIQVRRITRERARADRITEFMINMFKVSDPSEARGNTITAREILDKSAEEIDTGLVKDPELKAQMLQVMGSVYEGLGLYSRAESLLQRAVAIRRKVLGPEHSTTLETARQLVWIIGPEENRYSEGERMGRELISVEKRALGPNHRTTLATESDLSRTLGLLGHFAEAETLCRQVLEQQKRILRTDDPETLESERRLALVLLQQQQFSESERILRAILAARQRIFGPENLETLTAMDDLAGVIVEEDRLSEAEKLYRQELDAETRILGADHVTVISTALNLATVLESEDRYAESEKLQRDVLARCRLALRKDHPVTAVSLYDLADVLYREHRYEEAAPLYREAADIYRRVLGPAHPDTVDFVYSLARNLAALKKPEDSLSLLGDAVHFGVDAANVAEMEKGDGWKSLRGNPRFGALLAKARQHIAPPH